LVVAGVVVEVYEVQFGVAVVMASEVDLVESLVSPD
jgi:hypothetical protein